MDFDGKCNTRDVAWIGDCDEGCQLVADKLGWGVRYSFLYFCGKIRFRVIFRRNYGK